jgi:hypothetical protein
VTKLIGTLGNFVNALNYLSVGSVGRRNTVSPNEAGPTFVYIIRNLLLIFSVHHSYSVQIYTTL